MRSTFQIGNKLRNRNSGNTGTVVALPRQGCDWLYVPQSVISISQSITQISEIYDNLFEIIEKLQKQ